jgi:hypothetical protein
MDHSNVWGYVAAPSKTNYFDSVQGVSSLRQSAPNFPGFKKVHPQKNSELPQKAHRSAGGGGFSVLLYVLWLTQVDAEVDVRYEYIELEQPNILSHL